MCFLTLKQVELKRSKNFLKWLSLIEPLVPIKFNAQTFRWRQGKSFSTCCLSWGLPQPRHMHVLKRRIIIWTSNKASVTFCTIGWHSICVLAGVPRSYTFECNWPFERAGEPRALSSHEACVMANEADGRDLLVNVIDQRLTSITFHFLDWP